MKVTSFLETMVEYEAKRGTSSEDGTRDLPVTSSRVIGQGHNVLCVPSLSVSLPGSTVPGSGERVTRTAPLISHGPLSVRLWVPDPHPCLPHTLWKSQEPLSAGPGIWVQNDCCCIPLGQSPRMWVHEVGGHCSSATCIVWWLQNTLGHCLGWSGGGFVVTPWLQAATGLGN